MPGSRMEQRLVCRSGRQSYAIPLQHIVETMRVLPCEALSGAPAYVRGISIIRGAPTPVVDLGRLIGGHETQAGRLVVIGADGRPVALQVETILGIHSIDIEQLTALPPLLRDAVPETVTAIGSADQHLLLAIQAAKLVPDDIFDQVDRDGARR